MGKARKERTCKERKEYGEIKQRDGPAVIGKRGIIDETGWKRRSN